MKMDKAIACTDKIQSSQSWWDYSLGDRAHARHSARPPPLHSISFLRVISVQAHPARCRCLEGTRTRPLRADSSGLTALALHARRRGAPNRLRTKALGWWDIRNERPFWIHQMARAARRGGPGSTTYDNTYRHDTFTTTFGR